MKFGMCVQNPQIDYIDEIAAMGYDYIEGRFNLFTECDEELVEKMRAALERTGLKCEACNCFIPGNMKITGSNVDEDALRAYIEKGMSGASKLGCKIVVFGSGGARNIPEEITREEGENQIVHFLRDIVAPIAEKYDITVVTEPLRSSDSNVLNTVKEAVAMADRVCRPNIASLGDLFHMYAENETPESLSAFSGKVKHCHIADVTDRSYPFIGDEYDYKRFVDMMEKIGCERCSVEGSTKNYVDDSKKAIELLRSL